MKGKSSVIFSRPCVNGQPVAYAVGPARLHAHGWDPLVPTDAGVYDGLQEALRYVYPMGENIRSSTCYAVMGGHMVCGEARRMVWNLRPGFIPRTCGASILLESVGWGTLMGKNNAPLQSVKRCSMLPLVPGRSCERCRKGTHKVLDDR